MNANGTMLEGVEIFDVGTWNGIPFTDKDLDGIVNSFNALGLAGRCPLKFGHQGQDARTDGSPAIGWVQKIYRKPGDTKLYADFSNVNTDVIAQIKSGGYKFNSVELLKNVTAGNRRIPWVLDAVALLGATPPAVGTLAPMHASRVPLNFETFVSFTRQETNDDMATKEEFAALTKEHIATLLESAVREGRMLPCFREQFSRSFPDASVEDAKAFIRNAPRPPKNERVPVGPSGSLVMQHGGRADFRALDEAQKVILERRREGDPLPGQSFEQILAAAKEVFRRDPDLARAWMDAPGET